MYAFKIVTVNFANDPHIEILSLTAPSSLLGHGKGSLERKAQERGTLISCVQMALQLMSILVSRVKLAPARDVSKSDCSWITAKWERKARELSDWSAQRLLFPLSHN